MKHRLVLAGWIIVFVLGSVVIVGVIGAAFTTTPTPGTTTTPVPTTAITPTLQVETTTTVRTTTTQAPKVYYSNCSEAPGPLRVGEPGYRIGLDRDRDGVACDG